MFCIYKNGSFFSETPIDILGLFCYNQSSIGDRRELISLHFLIQKTCELSSCNDAVYLPSSTSYLPLFRWMIFLFWCVRVIMFDFLGLLGCKCNNLLLNTTRYQINHWIRVQEASGSNPDTPIVKNVRHLLEMPDIFYNTYCEIVLQSSAMLVFPENSNFTFPRLENHSSISLSKSNVPAVSTENAWILL